MIRRMVRLEQKFLNERFLDVIPGKRVRHERRQIVEIAWVDEVEQWEEPMRVWVAVTQEARRERRGHGCENEL